MLPASSDLRLRSASICRQQNAYLSRKKCQWIQRDHYLNTMFLDRQFRKQQMLVKMPVHVGCPFALDSNPVRTEEIYWRALLLLASLAVD